MVQRLLQEKTEEGIVLLVILHCGIAAAIMQQSCEQKI